jgi:hypothetical protein
MDGAVTLATRIDSISSGARSAERIHARVVDAIGRAPVDALAVQVVRRGAISNRAPAKHDGLDEGVSLP